MKKSRRALWPVGLFTTLLGLSSSAAFAHAEVPAPVEPPLLHLEALAFDPGRERLVVFGGAARRGTGGWSDSEEAWERDGGGWHAMPVKSGPGPRRGHSMAYDARRGVVVMFGGVRSRPAPGGAYDVLCDTWTYDGRSWRRDHEAACVTLRSGQLLWDDMRTRLILVEGPTQPPDDVTPRPLRLWQWADGQWEAIDSAGPRRTSLGSVAYDSSRGVLVVPVLSGPDAGTWEWDGERWSRHASQGPEPRSRYGIVYDARLRQVVMIGGRGDASREYFADSWSWDGRRWTERALSGAPGPGPRASATLVRDPRNQRLLYFGGVGEGLDRSELWEMRGEGWRRWAPAGDAAPPGVDADRGAVLDAARVRLLEECRKR